MRANIKLSICVPTYNRSGKLRSLYEGFLRGVANAHSDSVEILISDNSTKEHADINEALFYMAPVRYVRNNGNLGYAGNLIQCAELCTGEFIWIISDDDPIIAEAFDDLLATISDAGAALDCVFIPYFNENIYGDRLVVNRVGDWKNAPRLGQLLKQGPVPFTLLSSAVVRVDRTALDLVRRHSQNDYLHTILFLAMMRDDSQIVYFYRPMIDYKRNYDFPCSVVRMADSMREVLDLIAAKFAIKKSAKRDHEGWLLWLLHEKGGLYSFRSVKADLAIMRKRTLSNPTAKALVLLVLVQAPRWLVRWLYPYYITYKENQSAGHPGGYQYSERLHKMRRFINQRLTCTQ